MNIRSTIILGFVASFLTLNAQAEGWRSYHNTRFGVTADAPAEWTMGVAPENNDGRVFVSPDKRAEIIISGIFAVSSRGEEIASRLAPNEGETVTYKKRGSASVVVSGIKGDKIFYRKSMLSCHDTIWNDLSIEYPASEKAKYDALVAHVASSLRPGSGYDWIGKCK
jgi:serine/threonine-protein kinase